MISEKTRNFLILFSFFVAVLKQIEDV